MSDIKNGSHMFQKPFPTGFSREELKYIIHITEKLGVKIQKDIKRTEMFVVEVGS